MSPRRWRQLLAGEHLGALLPQGEDPHPNLFAEALTLPEGAFLVLPGFVGNCAYVLTRLLEALEDLAPTSATPLRQLAMAGLELSTHICERAGIRRGQRVGGTMATEIEIPPAEQFARLKAAVTFSNEDLGAFARRYGGDDTTLAPLISDRSLDWAYPDQERNPAGVRPILPCGDRLVVVSPQVLLGAINFALLRAIDAQGDLARFSGAFQRAVAADIASSLERLDAVRVKAPAFDQGFAELLYQIDADTLLQVHLLSDPLKDYEPLFGTGPWDCSAAVAMMELRAQALDRNIGQAHVVHVMAIQGIGRGTVAGSSHKGDKCVAIALDPPGLRVISILHSGDPTAIGRYADARGQLAATTQILSFSGLDEFALYRLRGDSFYLSDQERPNFMSITFGTGESALAEIQRTRDIHGVLVPWRSTFEQAILLKSDPTYPIYGIWSGHAEQLEFLLEIFSVPVWICGPPDEAPGHRRIYLIFLEAIAYWLWQFRKSIAEDIAAAGSASGYLRIDVVVEPSVVWTEGREDPSPSPPWSCNLLDGRICISIGPAAASVFLEADNTQERALVRDVIRAVGRMAAGNSGRSINEASLAAALDEDAPVGPKKMIVLLRSGANLRLLPGNLPDAPRIKKGVRALILDAVGKEFASRRWWIAGHDVPKADISDRIKEVVAVLFQRFESEVGQLSAAGLVNQLVARCESAVHDEALYRLHLTTRVACFGSEATIVHEMATEVAERGHAAIAGRFLLEYAAACPPHGTRRLSAAVYDRLIVLGGEIVAWGMRGDEHYYRLDDVQVSMLPSQRLVVDRVALTQAQDSFARGFAESELERGGTTFSLHWEGARVTDPARRDALDKACEAEFSLSMTEVVAFLGKAAEVGVAQSTESKTLALDAFTTQVAAGLGWPSARVEAALDHFVLCQRPQFLAPPGPHTAADVYPWRFNRELSYLRRPFIRVDRPGGAQLVWGIRQLDLAHVNLAHLCLSGRLRASSKGMKVFQSTVRTQNGEAFNDSVLSLCQSKPGCLAKKKVDHFGRDRLTRPNGESLGDIDVLAVVASKKTLLLIEAKSLEMARTPVELAREIEEHFGSGNTRPSTSDKHLERARWVKEHLREVLDWLALDGASASSWRTTPLIVTENEHVGARLRHNSIPSMSLRHLRDRWDEALDTNGL